MVFIFFNNSLLKNSLSIPSTPHAIFIPRILLPIFFFYNIIFKYHIPPITTHTHHNYSHHNQLIPFITTQPIQPDPYNPTNIPIQYTHKLYINTHTNHLPITIHPPKQLNHTYNLIATTTYSYYSMNTRIYLLQHFFVITHIYLLLILITTIILIAIIFSDHNLSVHISIYI